MSVPGAPRISFTPASPTSVSSPGPPITFWIEINVSASPAAPSPDR